jgi:hypothetical protein
MSGKIVELDLYDFLLLLEVYLLFQQVWLVGMATDTVRFVECCGLTCL